MYGYCTIHIAFSQAPALTFCPGAGGCREANHNGGNRVAKTFVSLSCYGIDTYNRTLQFNKSRIQGTEGLGRVEYNE